MPRGRRWPGDDEGESEVEGALRGLLARVRAQNAESATGGREWSLGATGARRAPADEGVRVLAVRAWEALDRRQSRENVIAWQTACAGLGIDRERLITLRRKGLSRDACVAACVSV